MLVFWIFGGQSTVPKLRSSLGIGELSTCIMHRLWLKLVGMFLLLKRGPRTDFFSFLFEV